MPAPGTGPKGAEGGRRGPGGRTYASIKLWSIFPSKMPLPWTQVYSEPEWDTPRSTTTAPDWSTKWFPRIRTAVSAPAGPGAGGGGRGGFGPGGDGGGGGGGGGDGGDGGDGGGFHRHRKPAGWYWQQHRQKHSLPSSFPHIAPPLVQSQLQSLEFGPGHVTAAAAEEFTLLMST